MTQSVYLDYQSTTPCDKRVVETMIPYFSDHFGNAHSDHFMGEQASNAVDVARQQVASVLGCSDQEVIFTSGATESNNLAIQGVVRYYLKQGHPARRVITIATEHKSVLEPIQALTELGIESVILPVTSQGLVDPDLLTKALEIPTLLVSIMAVNNETGIIQPVQQLARLAHEFGALVHCDLAQAVGKLPEPWDVKALDIDYASISGHKIYAPKGIGALYLRRKPRSRLLPLQLGGSQERGIRSGTLPVPLIVGLGRACELMIQEGQDDLLRLGEYRRYFIEELQKRIPNIELNSSLEHTVANSLNLRFPGVKILDIFKRIPHLYISMGSACTNSMLAPSYVLTAMGKTKDETLSSFRLSFGRMTTKNEVDFTLDALSQAWYDVSIGKY